jgi:tRNA threonylcarbamoyladenosine biosynthesis protein TsaB
VYHIREYGKMPGGPFGRDNGPDPVRGGSPTMLVLGFDTTTYHGSLALCDSTRGQLASVNLLSPESWSRRLLPMVRWLLDQQSLLAEDLDGLAVACGPGSFTGVRIGISIVQGIALAAQVPVVGVPTLEASALGAGVANGLVCPLLEAGRGEFYGALYETGGDGMVSRTVLQPLVMGPARLMDRVAAAAGNGEVCFAGAPPDALPGGAEAFKEVGGRRILGDQRFIATQVSRIGMRVLGREGEAPDPAGLAAIYVRPSDAELTTGGGVAQAGRQRRIN